AGWGVGTRLLLRSGSGRLSNRACGVATRSPRRHYARRFSLSDPSPLRRRQTSRDFAWVESASRNSVGVFCVLVFGIAGLVGVSSNTIVVVIAFVSLLDVARCAVAVLGVLLVDVASLIGVVYLPVGGIGDVPVVGIAGLAVVN